MLGASPVIAFAATRRPAAARAFYEDALGLRFVEDSPFALVFDCAGIELRVQKVEELAPAPYTTLGWHVEDLDRTVVALEKKGVTFERYGFLEQDEHGIWSAPGGARVAWMKDPDGNTLSLTQS
jgi:catechol 2,3-dioxygenase-like lactoylglutathione lyase family enzyme